MVELEHAFDLLNQLGLPVSANTLDAYMYNAAKADCTYLIFLTKLLEAQLASRQRRSIETRLKPYSVV